MAVENIDFKINALIDAGKAATTLGELRTNLKQLSDLAAEVGPNNAEAFNKITTAAGETRDRVKDIKESVTALAGTPMEKLVNSFSRLRQSIFELDFDKFKQSILSIKDGLLALGSQMIAPFTKAASAIKGLILGTESLTVAMSALGKAVGLVGLTGLVGTVGFLVAHFDKLKDSGGLIGSIFNYLEKSIKSLEISMVSLLDSLGLVDFNKWFSEGGKKEMIDTKKQNEELYKQKENEYRREINRENELFARDKARLDLEIRRAKLKDETGQKELKAQEELDRKTQQHLQRLLDIEKKRITETTKFLIQQQENPLPINIGGATKFFNEGRKIASERGLTPLFYWDMMERDLRTNYQTFLERLEKGEYDVEPERPNIRKPREYARLKKTITDVVEKNRDIIQTELEKVLVKVYESPATTLEQRKKDIVDAIKKNKELPKLLDVEAKDFSDRLFKFFDDTSLDISESFNAAKSNLKTFEDESAMNLARLRGEIAQRARERRQKMMEGLEPLRSLPTEGPASAIITGTEKPEDKAARLDETMKGIKEISDKRLKADKEGFDAAMESADNQERIRREKEDASIAYQKASAQEKLYYQQQIAFQGLSLANQVNDLIYQSDNQRATAQLELERKSAAFKAEARKKGLTEEQLYQQKLIETQNEVNRKQFNRNKALQIASAVVNTASAIAQINAQPLVNADISQTLRTTLSALVAAVGAAQIATIASAKYQPDAIPNTPVTPTSGITATETVTPAQFTVGEFKKGQFVDQRVYVVESDVTGIQRKVRVIENRSKF